MRTGGCTVQQTLTAEAASVLKHSLGLARRRGHAQVTPLHVAATLLSLRTSLLRRACLKSQSQPQQNTKNINVIENRYNPQHHPLQCRALELCFNVALNRLPTSTGPLLHGQPSLSNALIAALKRAQAHQRRGCIEQQHQQSHQNQQQQPPLLAIKVELEQLVISILDDPSVSRVMREAGFSSTAVKNNIEDASSNSSVFQCYSSGGGGASFHGGGVFSSPCSPSHHGISGRGNNFQFQREFALKSSTFWQPQFFSNYYSSNTEHQLPLFFSPQYYKSSRNQQNNNNSNNYNESSSADWSVKEESKSVLEVLSANMQKKKSAVIVGDSVSITEALVGEIMARMERADVPVELRRTKFIKFQLSPVSSRLMKKEDVEINIAELKRKVADFFSGSDSGSTSAVLIYTGDLKWAVFEDKNDPSSANVNGCNEYNPVDHLVAELGRLLSDYNGGKTMKVLLLSIASYQTYMRCQMRKPPLEIQWSLQSVFVPSGGSLGLSPQQASSIQVPEAKPLIINNNIEDQEMLNFCQECTSNYEKEAQFLKSGQQKLLPPWLLQSQGTSPTSKDELVQLRRKWNRLCHSLHSYQGMKNSQNNVGSVSGSTSLADSSLCKYSSNFSPKFRRQQSCTIEFNLGERTEKLQAEELTLGSLTNIEDEKEVKLGLALDSSAFFGSVESERRMGDLSRLLEENVPWQSEIIPSITKVIMEFETTRKHTWILMQGNDAVGKRRLSLAVAESMLGSAGLLLHMKMGNGNDENGLPYSEVLLQALRNRERLVVFVEDVDLADTQFLNFLRDGLETGNFGESNEYEEKNIGKAMIILSTSESASNQERNESKYGSVIKMKLDVTNTSDYKRKCSFELFNNIKNPRIGEKEGALRDRFGKESKKDFWRQSSFNDLDLNVEANEDGESEDVEAGDLSPISSDLTREATSEVSSFIDRIKNRFILNENQASDEKAKGGFLSKMRQGF